MPSDEKQRVSRLVSTLASTGVGGELQVDGSRHKVTLDARALDDCAAVSISGDVEVVVGSDYVRGPKFLLYERGFLSNRDIGRFLVTANISDIAAKGASPVGFLAVVRYPPEMTDTDFDDVMAGIDEACLHYETRLLGGDTGSAERLILSGSAIGLAPIGRVVTRSQVEPGDAIVLSGSVGGAGAAVLAAALGIQQSLQPEVWEGLLDCWRRPVAEPKLGRWMGASGLRLGCQDVSDGLRATAREMGELSALSAVLFEDAIPMHTGVLDVALLAGVDPVALALSASTDFCLLIACAQHDLPRLLMGMKQQGCDGRTIGHFELGEGVFLQRPDGTRVEAPGVEWRHQAGDIGVTIRSGLRSSSVQASKEK